MPGIRDDPSLVRAARLGDRAAFAELVSRHYGLLVASCRRVVGDGDLARDVAQEAVLRAMLGLGRLRDDERFGSWLIGIGLNVGRSLFGRGRRQPDSWEALQDVRRGEPVATEPEPVDEIVAEDLAARERSAIAALPSGQRQAVALFYLGGLTQAEIAQEVATAPGAVKTRLYKARRSLRASLLDTYKEYFDMTDQTADLIPMHVAELRRTAATDPGIERHIMFLQDDGDRRLPIWIGHAEATALATILEDVQLPRPGVYQFAATLLTGAGGQLREVRVTELTSSIFYAQAILSDGTVIDARPSDAITLALLAGVPIYVAAAVLQQAVAHQAAYDDLLQEAEEATDDAHVIAEEVRARHAASSAAFAAREKQVEPR
jgi:RNA polymerase sigma factor (sigma-70 family)